MMRQRGFGAIAAIVVLVILAVLSAAIVSFSTTQQIGSAQDALSARAWQAARAGTELGLYKALSTATPADPWKTCSGLSQTLDLTAQTGFNVTINCDSWLYSEGETAPSTPKSVRVFRVFAVACPLATCPTTTASAASVGYVERSRVVIATNQ